MTVDDLPPRPAPKPETELDGYWAATAAGHIGLGRCGACQEIFFPPQRVCPFCWSSGTGVEPASGRGVVEAFSVVHRHPAPAFQARLPYAVAMIRLAEGVAMTSSVVGLDVADIFVGMRVRAVFEAAADGTSIPLFAMEEK